MTKYHICVQNRPCREGEYFMESDQPFGSFHCSKLEKTINLILMYLLATFIASSQKKSLEWTEIYEDTSFWAQNDPIAPNKHLLENHCINIF